METNRTTDPAGIPADSGDQLTAVDFSVCIVTYQACEYLRACLRSLYENTHRYTFEVIVVDNGSTDQVGEVLAREFPAARLIQNQKNEGFTAPMNQALQAGRGGYLLQLNPDTIVFPEALDRLVAFLESHQDAGICGPKVLNQDRTLQLPCRRGEARPLAVIGYFTGLARLFPYNKRLNGYLLTYLDEDQTVEVAGVSGSCMLIRRDVVDQIGYLDESFFAYQEDADYCFRARQAGWKVLYYPEAQIIHFGGQGGSRVEPFRAIIAWHRSYWLYYRKHLASDYFFLFNWFYYFLMLVKLILTLGINIVRREKYVGARR
jgi:GT2 family glycosyltransferase